MKLGIQLYARILNSPTDSLLRESYISLRRISDLFPDTKYSWCSQMRSKLTDLGFESVWTKDSVKYLYSYRDAILDKLRQDLGEADMNLARESGSIPHYQHIVNGAKAEAYLTNNLPTYLVTCIAQVRLNYSVFFNKGKWYNLGMFNPKMCGACGDLDSFSHLFSCPSNQDLQDKYLPFKSDVINTVRKNVHPTLIKNIYFFICSALRRKPKFDD
jgi:hypothetical protein